jgi:tartrate-resistant acid phosphatase type 5
MPDSEKVNRRDFLRKALVFSAALMAPGVGWSKAAALTSSDTLHLFCFGDWGSGADANQKAVAAALQNYSRQAAVTPQAMMLLGDNFYGPISGVDSSRWQKEFEDMYPADVFPGPCYAILGNHDYDDQPGGEKFQLAYAKKLVTRWKMPERWYRLDLPEARPIATILCTNTHYAKLSVSEIAEQEKWLEDQFAAPRTTSWLVVCGHHPVLSCGPHHGDSPYLKPWRELFYRQKVDAYVCGHEHDLQHLREEGKYTDWLVSGGGGRSLHPVARNEKTQFAQEQFGFLHLAIDSNNLSATFVGINAQPIYSMNKQLAT